MTRTIIFQNLRPTPELRPRLTSAYSRVMSSGQFILGKEVEAFEDEWAEYCQARYCVGVSSGFAALQLAMLALDVRVRKGVIVPAKTCYPVWAAVMSIGAVPIASDRIDERVDAARIVVHLYGQIQPVYSSRIPIIEDASQAHGATFMGHKAGAWGKVACWSFYPTKNLGAYGDAGAITTDDIGIAETIASLRNYGYGSKVGINGRLDPLQAAFLRAKLPFLDKWNDIRRCNAMQYFSGLKDVPGIELPYLPDGYIGAPCYHQFVITCDKRGDLKAYLENQGVQTMIHYPAPPHRELGMYANYIYQPWAIEAEQWSATVLSLPIAQHLGEPEIAYVIAKVKEWANA